MSVGLRTRTEIDRILGRICPDAGKRWAAVECKRHLVVCRRACLAARMRPGFYMPGGAVLSRGETLKSVAHVSRRVLNPRLPVCHWLRKLPPTGGISAGLKKPVRTRE